MNYEESVKYWKYEFEDRLADRIWETLLHGSAGMLFQAAQEYRENPCESTHRQLVLVLKATAK